MSARAAAAKAVSAKEEENKELCGELVCEVLTMFHTKLERDKAAEKEKQAPRPPAARGKKAAAKTPKEPDEDAWKIKLVEACIPAMFERVVECLKSDSKCRLQSSFGRPPKAEEMSVLNVASLARIDATLVPSLVSLIQPHVLTAIEDTQNSITTITEQLRNGPAFSQSILAACKDARDHPTFGKVVAQGNLLADLKTQLAAKLPLIDQAQAIIDERAQLTQYYGFSATDLCFSFHGTTQIPLQEIRERVFGKLEALDAALKECVEGWERTHGEEFRLDEDVRLLDLPDAFVAPAIKGAMDGGGGGGDPKMKSRKSAQPPTPKKEVLAKGEGPGGNKRLSGVKKKPERQLPPGVIKVVPQFRSALELPPLPEPSEGERAEEPIEEAEGARVESGKVFRVVVRLRPLIKREVDSGDEASVEPKEDNKTVHFKVQALALGTVGLTFDWCVSGAVAQQTFFKQSGVIPLLKDALNGENVTVMAYGQTGSGKTFSMAGPEEFLGANSNDRLTSPDVPQVIGDACYAMCAEQESNQGLIPRTIKALFQRMRAVPNATYKVEASYLEIYNEKVQDLLVPRDGGLQVRMDPDHQCFFVHGLTQLEAKSDRELLRLFVLGSFNRKVANTNMNSESSRSHALFTIHLTKTENRERVGEVVTQSKMVLVDLAGSERLKQIGARADRNNEETSSINKSLFALSNVIARLGAGATDHIPFRDSNLTKLLMDTLGYNGKSLLIACLSPSSRFVDESLNTLSFASKAANIEKHEVVNLSPHELELKRLHDIIEELQGERDLWRAEAHSLKDVMLANNLALPADSCFNQGEGDEGAAPGDREVSMESEGGEGPKVDPAPEGDDDEQVEFKKKTSKGFAKPV